jgi:hypothetical protein
LGLIDNYRQGFESNTGRFGGTPSLKLVGVWSGGYLVTSSIIKNIDNGMTAAIFSAGIGFLMSSRFKIAINADLGTLAPLIDFSNSNFVNPSTVQIQDSIITRNGVSNAEDTTISPNLAAEDLVSSWKNNTGLVGTHVGGTVNVTVEIPTVISFVNTFEVLAGTWSTDQLEHFDSPSNGQMRHLSDSPAEFEILGELIIDGKPNDDITVRVRRFISATGLFSTVRSIRRQINSLSGGRDVAFFTIVAFSVIDINDYIILEVANNTGTVNVTAEFDSFFTISER